MFTTDYLLLLPVIGVAAGLVVALLVVRAQELRLASVCFSAKGSKLLLPLYVKEGGMVALSIPLALIIFGSSALMLKEYLKPPTVPRRVVIPWDPTKIPLPPPIGGVEPTEPTAPAAPSTPTGGGIPKPVVDNQAATGDIGTQNDWAAQANAGTIDPNKLNRDSVEIVRVDIPAQEFAVMERYPELIKRVDPVYPEIAVAMGCEGKVYVQLLLDLDGTVMRTEVKKSSGNPALDEAAVTAVKQWVFTPAIAPGGKPTRVWQLCPVVFRLAK